MSSDTGSVPDPKIFTWLPVCAFVLSRSIRSRPTRRIYLGAV